MIVVGAITEDGSTWAAATSSADTPTVGSATLLAPLRDFWADPGAAPSRAEGREVTLGEDGLRVVPPVLPEARVICVGLNYDDHIAEGSFKDAPRSAYPTLFGRWTRSLAVGGQSVKVPVDERGLDWEGEIAAWIGHDLTEVTPEEGRAGVLGYSTFNDITARIAQKRTSQFALGKNVDNSGPIGPLVTAEAVGDLRRGLDLETRVNGELVQKSTTAHQIFELGDVLSYVSRTFTLRAGDILCTGTPSGVGYARDPEWLLDHGDLVEVSATALGTLRTRVVR